MAQKRKLSSVKNGDEEKRERLEKVNPEKDPSSDSDGEEKGKKRRLGLRASSYARRPEPPKKKKIKVFSDQDVVNLLEGLHRFWANGRNNKWTEFHHFIKDNLSTQFTRIQVSEKIRSLKTKFESNSERGRGSADFSDPHEAIVFELSKRLWGDEKEATEEDQREVMGDEKETREKQEKKVRREEFEAAYPLLYASFESTPFLKQKCILIPTEKAKELEEQWTELCAEALRIELRKLGRL